MSYKRSGGIFAAYAFARWWRKADQYGPRSVAWWMQVLILLIIIFTLLLVLGAFPGTVHTGKEP